MNKYFKYFIYLLLIIVFLSFFWNYFFFFDLFSHFYLQLFVISVAFLIYNFFQRNKIETIISILLWLFLFLNISRADFSSIYRDNIIKYPDLFFMNTEFLNNDINEITDYINEINPKRIAMVELNKELFEKIKNKNKFKYSYYFPKYVYSFGFFTNDEVLEQRTYFSQSYPIWYFRTKNISYYIVHPLPPISRNYYNLQKMFFNDLVELLKKEKNEFVLVWDLNSSFYSSVFQFYFGNYFYKPVYSWSVDSILTIPIDYAISNTNLKVYPWSKLSSDHIPLLIKF